MAGAVGVWGKKPAQFGRTYAAEKAQSEGLKSLYVTWEANGEVTVKGTKAEKGNRDSIELDNFGSLN